MKFIADLHVHSRYSRATSKTSDLHGLYSWAQVKGIHLVGTGDFTHPAWFSRLKENLIPAEPGLFKLKNDTISPAIKDVHPEAIPTRFMLTSEISSIYKKDDKVRKIHNLLMVPDFESAEKISSKLAAIGNIESDGRPILGLDVRDLLEILLENSADGFLVPAHIWTPWFSLFGSKSGFDAIEDCFGDLTDHIFALETGLSSDPEMNRLISALDRFTLISNSDCHSPAKLGREANLFDTGFDFYSLKNALNRGGKQGFLGTIEFYPEEGKYHYDGHRKCNVCLEPLETKEKDYKCPVCQKPLTVGVMHRVMELADRQEPVYPEGQKSFESLVPLPEILGEILQVGSGSKKVMSQYARLISMFGSEFNIFRNVPTEEITHIYSEVLAEAIQRIRTGHVIRKPGYDGEFGVIKVFNENEIGKFTGQTRFFVSKAFTDKAEPPRKEISQYSSETQAPSVVSEAKPSKGLNPEQAKAVQSLKPNILVSAGPGTGKTFTLITRLTRLLQQGVAKPSKFAVITFTNKAADEIRQRLSQALDGLANEVFVGTFHRFCLEWLRKQIHELSIVGPEQRQQLLRTLFPNRRESEISELNQFIMAYFFQTSTDPDTDYAQISLDKDLETYRRHLTDHQAVDLDAIIPSFVHKLSVDNQFHQQLIEAVNYLFIDEFQDLNLSQYELVQLLTDHMQIFAIGDPNQAIYGFRGCDPLFFQRFVQDFPVETIELHRNYRSVPSILRAASAVIRNNDNSGEVTLLPQRKNMARIQHIEVSDAKLEAETVARNIDEMVGGMSHLTTHSREAESEKNQISFNDIAVLYRLSDQAKTFADVFGNKGIPFQLIDAQPFFMEKDVRPLFYWLVCASASESPSHLQLLRHIPKIGRQSIQKIERRLPIKYRDFFQATGFSDLSKGVQAQLSKLQKNLAQFRDSVGEAGLAASLILPIEFMQLDLDHPNIDRLLKLAPAFGKDLHGFSNHLQQNAAATIYDDRAEAVSLMTIHASKGLEFPVVFLTGLEEDILPCNLPGLDSDIEEERRLFFVAMTRAENQLVLSSSRTRLVYGKKQNQLPSRFIEEIPAELIDRSALKTKPLKKKTGDQLSF